MVSGSPYDADMTSLYQDLGHGVTAVDTGFVRPQFDAAYLLIENGRAAFIDTGPNAAVPRLLAALEAHGLAPEDVDYVIPTHVHLDHAGGAGLLMREAPRAKLVVHPRGARHMIDPAALMQGVREVYGNDVAARDYGELIPVPAERVITTADGMTLDLAGRPLLFLDTPGHARHHHCIWDARSRGWFTGDTFGIAYPELYTVNGPYMVPATAPVQFDREALHASVKRLLDAEPQRMYLTHYGAVNDVKRCAAQFLAQVDAMAAAAIALAAAPDRHAQLKRAFGDIYLAELRRHGSVADEATLREVLATDIELNAQGLGVWLDKR
jgi:glyoxylase-like metal-dependent hydrolase (beta-lactamase superfamily II)